MGTLFNEPTRVIDEPWYGIAHYDFLNGCSREGYPEMRSAWETAFKSFPEYSKNDVRARFKSKSFEQHQSAAFELYLHSLLLTCGLIPVTQTVADQTPGGRPDFLFQNDQGGKLSFEAHCVFSPNETNAFRLFEYSLVKSINQRYPNLQYTLSIEFMNKVNRTLSLSGIILRFGNVISIFDEMFTSQKNLSGPCWEHAKTCKIDELVLKVYPHIASDGMMSSSLGRGVRMGSSAHLDNTHELVRKALQKKGSHYAAELRTVLCCNIVGSMGFDFDSVCDALFGDTVLHCGISSQGEIISTEPSRAHNGFWQHRGVAQNTRVPAVLFFHNIGSTHYDSTEIPSLILNPFIPNIDAIPVFELCEVYWFNPKSKDWEITQASSKFDFKSLEIMKIQ
ncbi:MAG: hypothetical protein SGI97_03995 [candidate division Zixibacteria bacterium]|nr:hypothetical protein [candidate division Zixibacteria bacterium]